MAMTNSSDEEQTPLRIHSNSDYDFAMRINFIKGSIYGFDRMLNYCSKPDNNVVTYDQIASVKQSEMKVLEANLKEIQKTVNSLHIEACDRIEFKTFIENRKNKKGKKR